MVEITNEEDLEKWLDKQSAQVRYVIATRASLRVFLNVLSDFSTKKSNEVAESRALWLGHSLLIAVIRAHDYTTEISTGPLKAFVLGESVLLGFPNHFELSSLSSDTAIALAKHEAQKTSAYKVNSSYALASGAFLSADSMFPNFRTDKALSAIQFAKLVDGALTYVPLKFDAQILDQTHPSLLMSYPLCEQSKLKQKYRDDIIRLKTNFLTNHPEFKFWVDWYKGFLDGTPMDWGIQESIALIPDEDWEKGAKHIARLIEDILKADIAQMATQALDDINDLDEFRPRGAKLVTDNERARIGGNNPPEALTKVEFNSIRTTLATVSQEVAKPVPDKSKLLAAIDAFGAVTMRIAGWTLKKCDLTLDEFFKELGKKGAGAVSVLLGGYALKILGILQPIIDLLKTLTNIL